MHVAADPEYRGRVDLNIMGMATTYGVSLYFATTITMLFRKSVHVATPATKPVAVVAVGWGRKSKADNTNKIVAVVLILFCPALLLLNSITLEYYGGNLYDALAGAVEHPSGFVRMHTPSVTLVEVVGYGAWLCWHAVLYIYLPGGQCSGQLTPGGHVLRCALMKPEVVGLLTACDAIGTQRTDSTHGQSLTRSSLSSSGGLGSTLLPSLGTGRAC